MDKAGGYALAVALALTLLLPAARTNAASVSGSYSDRRGTPLSGHQLHFENRISGDIYLTRTGADGSFSAELPPGSYDLRAERGLVLHRDLHVDREAVNLGRVEDGAPLDVRRPFQREGIAPSMVETAAPATAHLPAGNESGAKAAPAAAPPAASSAQTAPATSAAASSK